jgi:hypothetical protein
LAITADGTTLWTGTFDEKFTDIFVVQDAISRKVAAALALQLSGDEQARLEKRPTNNVAAYDFYLRGRFHAQKLTATDLRKAIEFYQKAVNADPNYALALAGMVDVIAFWRLSPLRRRRKFVRGQSNLHSGLWKLTRS